MKSTYVQRVELTNKHRPKVALSLDLITGAERDKSTQWAKNSTILSIDENRSAFES